MSQSQGSSSSHWIGKSPSLPSRGATSLWVSVLMGSVVGSEPAPPASFPPILPQTPNLQSATETGELSLSALQTSLPGSQGYLGQDTESQSRFPQPRCCWIWISGTHISNDLENDHIAVRTVSSLPAAPWAEVQEGCQRPSPQISQDTHKICAHMSSGSPRTSWATETPALTSTWNCRRPHLGGP